MMNITLLENGFLRVDADQLGSVFTHLSSMPGRKRWKDRSLIVQPSGINLDFIISGYPQVQWEPGAAKVRDEYLSMRMEEHNARQDKRDIELKDDSGYEYKTIPRPHQTKSFILARDKITWGHFHAPRTGKTKVIIDTAAYLFERGKIDRLAVVAPNGVHSNWVLEEIPKHLPDRINFSADFYSSSDGKRAADRVQRIVSNRNPNILKIVTFNVEGFVSDKAQALLEAFLACGPALLVVDESTRISNPSAKRTKFIVDIGQHAAYRRILTGTPVTRGVENLYSQFKFLDSRILGHETFTTFRSHYCIMGGFENRAITGYRDVQKLLKIIDGHSDRVKAEDCGLPPKQYLPTRKFEMTPHQRRMYDAFRKESLAELQALLGEEEGLKRAKEVAVTKFLRLHQIACFLTPSEKPTPFEGTNPRLNTLMDVLEEYSDDKIIIWARFTADLRMIYSKLGAKAVPYWGETSADDRIKTLRRFRDDDKVRYVVAHQQAAGIGLDFSAAAGCIYYSSISNLELRLQSEDRPVSADHGSKFVLDIEALKSVDRKIINRLAQRKELADELARDPISLFEEE